MSGQNVPAPGREAWKHTIQRLMTYRGFTSPQKLERAFDPPRLGYQTVYRIMDLDPRVKPGGEGCDDKLGMLSGMLALPVETLRLFYAGDAEGIRRLEFRAENGPQVKQFILDTLAEAVSPPRNRRSTDRKRAAR